MVAVTQYISPEGPVAMRDERGEGQQIAAELRTLAKNSLSWVNLQLHRMCLVYRLDEADATGLFGFRHSAL